jgi:hypothetical protein
MVHSAAAASQLRNRLPDPQGRIRLGLPGRGHPAGQFVEYVRPRTREVVAGPGVGKPCWTSRTRLPSATVSIVTSTVVLKPGASWYTATPTVAACTRTART